MPTVPESLGLRLDVDQLNVRGTFRGLPKPRLGEISLYALEGQSERTASTELDVEPGHSVIALQRQGAALVRGASNTRWTIVPPGSLVFVRGSAQLVAVLGRGSHKLDLIAWPNTLTPQIDAWLASKPAAIRAGGPMCGPIRPHFETVVNRIDIALETEGPVGEMLALSAIYEMVPLFDTGVAGPSLVTLPSTMPETLRELADQVALEPHRSWALKEASAMAGYSPFHFSRVFKQIVGHGFHEYVDRCRTGLAIERLCSTDEAVDMVAASCGFGSSHSLRESMKEYIGLVPSELRSMSGR